MELPAGPLPVQPAPQQRLAPFVVGDVAHVDVGFHRALYSRPRGGRTARARRAGEGKGRPTCRDGRVLVAEPASPRRGALEWGSGGMWLAWVDVKSLELDGG